MVTEKVELTGNLETDETYQCKICSAHATGFHFNAQACSACAAYYRRAVVLSRSYKCVTGKNECVIFYKERSLCKRCRFAKCEEMGMRKDLVQTPQKNERKSSRSYFTKSGLKRNKRFAVINVAVDVSQSSESIPTPSVEETDSPIVKNETPSSFSSAQSSPSEQSQNKTEIDILSRFVVEEMRISERRRIMFCERPVSSLLGLNRDCPFGKDDIKPLRFRNFRRSIRIHILLIYEWLRVWPSFTDELDSTDQITFFRKCALYHTLLDPIWISIQFGDPEKFVLQNGGYLSVSIDSDQGFDDGWQDEEEISRENKKRIYWPLLNRIKSEILDPMKCLNLSFEEFVALKAFVSMQMSASDISESGRPVLRRALDTLSSSLYQTYPQSMSDLEKAERLGSVIMLITPIFVIGTTFVEQHHLVTFFDIWQLDSILVEFLKNRV
ncbi:hypothetical protein M3Y94_00813000 [Aphelenchoides besseyi]|nr:hypothetical protein M3Y94_00813000 [Aphelenchoides besseyi]KAI6227188.1 Ligand-binding domain of nuclear hormone receptor [Aphelenchoides besseyi]